MLNLKMYEPILATVQVGTKYTFYDVLRLRNMINSVTPNKLRFACITDNPQAYQDTDILTVKVDKGPPFQEWWAKMKLFDQSWRSDQVVYFDLDTLIVNDISKLLKIKTPFMICRNFTQLAGNTKWPCRYGSCVMSIGPYFGSPIYQNYINNHDKYCNASTKRYGDQYVIEKLVKNPDTIQDRLGYDYVIGWRDVLKHSTKPKHTALVAYAGGRRPTTIGPLWANRIWTDALHS